jgi:hypothetical protein
MKIKVFVYHSGGSIMHPIKPDETPKVLEVEAHCVGGEEGIFATFRDPNNPKRIMYAQGDDGHWWYAGSFSEQWLPKIIASFELVQSN